MKNETTAYKISLVVLAVAIVCALILGQCVNPLFGGKKSSKSASEQITTSIDTEDSVNTDTDAVSETTGNSDTDYAITYNNGKDGLTTGAVILVLFGLYWITKRNKKK